MFLRLDVRHNVGARYEPGIFQHEAGALRVLTDVLENP
jgi:hypothetical protein